jgi:CHASE2 domain-containing sensor protein
VINVDNCDRNGVLDAIHTIDACHPKAIGLDIYFAVPQENNDYLLQTLLTTDNLVCAMRVDTIEGGAYYQRIPLSFFDDTLSPQHSGYVNLDVAHSWNVVRTFLPYVCTSENDTLPSMALELAKVADAERADQLLQRGNAVETIDFTSHEIEIIEAEKLGNADVQERLSGKVVLIGVIDDIKDSYLTPLHDPKPGVLIHAYALQTILSASYIKTSPAWLNWMIAICICLVFLILLRTTKNHVSYVGFLVIRFSQFAIMYGLIWCGCQAYSGCHLYMDFAPSILMLGLASLAYDFATATYGIINNIVQKYKRHTK